MIFGGWRGTLALEYLYNIMELACAESYGFLGIAIVAPPNLLLNSDILDILATFNAFALEKSIKQVNMKLFKRFTVLTSF